MAEVAPQGLVYATTWPAIFVHVWQKADEGTVWYPEPGRREIYLPRDLPCVVMYAGRAVTCPCGSFRVTPPP